MLEEIRKRIYNLKNRLYVEGKYLRDADFDIGKKITYYIDKVNKKITVELTEKDSRNSVAQTTVRNNKVPVIDIKAKEVKEFFQTHDNIEVSIYKGKIIFTVIGDVQGKVVELQDRRKTYSISLSAFSKAVGYEQTRLFDLFSLDNKDDHNSRLDIVRSKTIKVISLFSGAGLLDKGFLDTPGYEFVFAIDKYGERELKDYHIQTYKANIGDHIVMKDILELTEEDVINADLVIGGIPCVKFSNLNTKNNFRDTTDISHPLVEKYLQVVQWSKAKAFLIENVKNFLTVKGGAMLKRITQVLGNFKITNRVISGTELGSAQKRERAYILGMQGKQPVLDIPPVTKVKTVRDAFKEIEVTDPQQDMYFKPTPKRLEMMKYIEQGGNIRQVPIELRPPNKKFSNFCQRLSLDSQAPTITHVFDDVFIHPTEMRYISVAECRSLFSLPKNFIFKGSLTSIFEQLKNGVDYAVSTFLAKTIREQLLPIL